MRALHREDRFNIDEAVFGSDGDGRVYEPRLGYRDEGDTRILIHPCLCVYGASTEYEFYKSLSREEVHYRWLSRYLVFMGDSKPRTYWGRRTEEPPSEIIGQVSRWWARKIRTEVTEGSGNPTGLLSQQPTGIVIKPPEPMIVRIEEEPEQAYRSLYYEAEEIRGKLPELGMLWDRSEEAARKVGLIVAAGKNFEKPIITLPIADYACRLIRYLLTDLMEGYQNSK